MKIKEMLSQSRRDFTAIYECEGCGEEVKRGGYDDRYFHDSVIPNMKCKGCGESRKSLGLKEQNPTPTKYAAHEVI